MDAQESDGWEKRKKWRKRGKPGKDGRTTRGSRTNELAASRCDERRRRRNGTA